MRAHLLAFSLLLPTLTPALASAQIPPLATPSPLPPTAPDAPQRRSTGVMVAGIVLTSVASAALVGGVISTAAFGQRTDTGAWSTILVSLPMIGGSALLAAVGVPLWVLGASAPGPRSGKALPAVNVGAGSATLRWAF